MGPARINYNTFSRKEANSNICNYFVYAERIAGAERHHFSGFCIPGEHGQVGGGTGDIKRTRNDRRGRWGHTSHYFRARSLLKNSQNVAFWGFMKASTVQTYRLPNRWTDHVLFTCPTLHKLFLPVYMFLDFEIRYSMIRSVSHQE